MVGGYNIWYISWCDLHNLYRGGGGGVRQSELISLYRLFGSELLLMDTTIHTGNASDVLHTYLLNSKATTH